jgi:hypothetical protein
LTTADRCDLFRDELERLATEELGGQDRQPIPEEARIVDKPHPWYPSYYHEPFGEALEAANRYWASIVDRLPPDLVQTRRGYDGIYLHDGAVRDFAFDFVQRVVRFGVYRHSRRLLYRLRYGGVSELVCRVLDREDLAYPVSGSRDEWRYDDMAVLADGRYEHSILLLSGVEIVTRFTSFTASSEVLGSPDDEGQAGVGGERPS